MTLTTAPHQAIVVVGLGYGDESKGATVDFLTASIPDTVAVVRWSGGAQAAHNVRHGFRHHTFSQFGSGTFLDVRTILRAPMLVNPILLAAEAAALERQAVRDPLGLIVADARCLVTTPIHIAMNRAREIVRGAARHGSTGLGIGETVAFDLAVRAGARRGDVIGNFVVPADAPHDAAPTLGTLRSRPDTLRALDAMARYAEPLLAMIDDGDAQHEPVEQMATELCAIAEHLSIADDIDHVLRSAMDAGTVVFEGSQGMLLDEWHGFHPHTTWATLTPRHLVAGLAAASRDPYVLGLTRPYATRHGDGPMPTEDASLVLAEPDNREGRYQGGWRSGHLDLPALRYAAEVAGRIDGVAVSHLDMLGTAPLQVADSWAGHREPLAFAASHDLGRLDALTQVARGARPDLRELPVDPDAVTALIAETVGAPVVLTATGPHRSDRSLRAEAAQRRTA
ncbi:adenylosuccinate synthetase [Microbacterium sp. Root166]|uniref:adenylosuccinate synthetase n=1 Tax=Microbacterium sp. Root166 TaxID=1736478 RepID=UPI0006FE2DCA|nr:adenylosuccinate synthetase [Microbacterium sp. Root166]KQZ84189.1 adenylosuccinate synthetase [Microbacterium sp. Root166]